MRLMRNISSSTILDDSTIVAIATPLGVGAISIVRLSGREAYGIALKLTHRENLKARYAHLCSIYDKDNTPIDEAIILYFPAPHSYTTQDVCEVQCHGGVIGAKAIMQLCLCYGARIAQAGEFAKRAFLGGRMDLAQIQAVSGLIHSQSLEANKILMRQLKGEVSVFIGQMREAMIELLAFSEVNIDYSEEVEEDYKEAMSTRLEQLRGKLQEVYEISLARSDFINGYTLSIIGKPNVGKSSLLNAFLMYERAIVSDIEGTTRDTIEESLHINGALVRIVDTAGIRQSDDEIERIGINKTKEALERSNIILALFDASSPLDSKDKEVLEMLKGYSEKHILFIANKADLPPMYDEQVLKHHLCSYPKAILPYVLKLSVQTQGVQKIIESLKALLSSQAGNGQIILSSAHALSCLKNALDSLSQAHLVLHNGELELFSYCIRDAIESLNDITHPYEDRELLDRLFSTFCLGK